MSVGPLDPHLRQAAWSAVGAVPGCALAHATLTTQRPAATLSAPGGTITHPATRRFSVGITGWSPSLHRVEIEWRLEGAIGMERRAGSKEREIAELLRLLEPRLAVQRRRAAAALAMYQAVPMGTDDQRIEIGHLTADASVLALAIARGEVQGRTPDMMVREIVGPMVRSVHREAMDYDGGDILRGPLGSVSDTHGVPHAVACFEFGPGNALSTSVAAALPGWSKQTPTTVSGDTILIVAAPPPEAACAAARGRTVGELVALHGVLAPRTIAEVTTGDGWTSIRMEPVRVLLDDVLRLGSHEALALLRNRVIEARRPGR